MIKMLIRPSIQLNLSCIREKGAIVRAHSHQEKANAKAKIFFDV